MSEGVLVDSSAWGFYFRPTRRQPPEAVSIAEEVRELVRAGGAWIHPVVAGEVLLGGVDPHDAFDGLPWLDVSGWSARDELAWLYALPAAARRGVGWADCAIVHGALRFGLRLLTGDAGQRALWKVAARTWLPR